MFNFATIIGIVYSQFRGAIEFAAYDCLIDGNIREDKEYKDFFYHLMDIEEWVFTIDRDSSDSIVECINDYLLKNVISNFEDELYKSIDVSAKTLEAKIQKAF